MLDLRPIKLVVPAFLIFYLMKRRLPFVIEGLAKCCIREGMRGQRHLDPVLQRRQIGLFRLLRDLPDAISRGDMTLLERLVVLATFLIYLSLPDWISMAW